jgi:hypothetical protein
MIAERVGDQARGRTDCDTGQEGGAQQQTGAKTPGTIVHSAHPLSAALGPAAIANT